MLQPESTFLCLGAPGSRGPETSNTVGTLLQIRLLESQPLELMYFRPLNLRAIRPVFKPQEHAVLVRHRQVAGSEAFVLPSQFCIYRCCESLRYSKISMVPLFRDGSASQYMIQSSPRKLRGGGEAPRSKRL